MKKIATIFVPAMILFTTTVNAQFSKGDVLLGGTISLSTSVRPQSANSNRSTYNSYGIGPKVGFFLNDKFAIGAMAGYSSQTYEYGTTTNNTIQTDQSINAGIFGRRYFTISDKFFFTLQGSLSFSRDGYKYESGSLTTDRNESYTVTAAITPILVFLPSPHWGFEGGIGSLNYSHNQGLLDDTSSNAFQLSAGSINFGVAYYFRKAIE